MVTQRDGLPAVSAAGMMSGEIGEAGGLLLCKHDSRVIMLYDPELQWQRY